MLDLTYYGYQTCPKEDNPWFSPFRDVVLLPLLYPSPWNTVGSFSEALLNLFWQKLFVVDFP